METSTYGRISAAVVPVETAAPGNGPALPLPTPPETPHHISATVVLSRMWLSALFPVVGLDCWAGGAFVGRTLAGLSIVGVGSGVGVGVGFGVGETVGVAVGVGVGT